MALRHLRALGTVVSKGALCVLYKTHRWFPASPQVSPGPPIQQCCCIAVLLLAASTAHCSLQWSASARKRARACVYVSVRTVLVWVAIAATGELPAPPTQTAGILCSLNLFMGRKISGTLGRAPKLRGGPCPSLPVLPLHPMVGFTMRVLGCLCAACVRAYSHALRACSHA